ncbi:MAG: three-Cys-motif partner protein TcmP [Candidatus Acidiferrales bacterium]
MDSDNESQLGAGETLQHLKRVSRIKHIILQKYLLPWASILGSWHRQLAYFDCFAGPGKYELDGKPVAGSPVIAVEEAIEFLRTRADQSLVMYLLDDKRKHVEQLENSLKCLQPYPQNLAVNVRCVDSRSYIQDLLGSLNTLGPSFFLIDPYGHPLALPVINSILRRDRTEVLINLMWFQINRDINNPKVESRLNELFGDNDWRKQPFVDMRGTEREKAFLEYFKSRLECRFVLPFKIRYDIEDPQGGDRTKYYLLHASNHAKAVLLMKEVMWPLGDEEGTFDYSGESQGVLISETPTEQELRNILLLKFQGKDISFDELCERTWYLPFIPKHYRSVLRSMEENEITILRITSTKTGISGADRIRFK